MAPRPQHDFFAAERKIADSCIITNLMVLFPQGYYMKKLFLFGLGVLTVAALTLSGCPEAIDTSKLSGTVTVYIAGFFGPSGSREACYWKSTERVSLSGPPGTRSQAMAITAAGDTVYTAGYYEEDFYDDVLGYSYPIRHACYWINQNRVELSELGEGSEALAITVQNGIVYTAGYYDLGGYQRACYWIDQNRTDLPDLEVGSWARAITVVDSDSTVYTAGYYNDAEGYMIACYWTGQNRTDLSDSEEDSEAMVITVQNSTVYTAGNYYDEDSSNWIPCYWIGTGFNPLSFTGSNYFVNSITALNGTVYIAGRVTVADSTRACYWTSTVQEPTQLPFPGGAQSSNAGASTVLNGSVYFGGSFRDDFNRRHACYWNDGKSHDLGVIGLSTNIGISSSFIGIR